MICEIQRLPLYLILGQIMSSCELTHSRCLSVLSACSVAVSVAEISWVQGWVNSTQILNLTSILLNN